MKSSEGTRCAECGGELPPGLPRGLCPRCALQAAAELSDTPDEYPSGRPATLAQAGDHIGRYKLLQQIGEGGFGVVFLAEQTEPLRRTVALKVIKLGMDTKSVIARFEAERQALALMDHPNIAKVFDAGATETGRPYFVMELVKGRRLTDYCDQHNLSMTARLELFAQICHAIQHAHQKGIIHRDIKPSNILVTLHDGVPVPKVIDFGIAKATSDLRLTDKTLFTAFEQFMGTPAYMSPEQAEMSGLDIDTRSDIYSLGVLLYQLLTDHTPFNTKELLRAGFDELRRTIREQEPARPSTRLSTLLAADLTAVAATRQTDATKLVNVLRGDLDWIVMKSLEKDRKRRYDTADAFALDIQRYLDGEPVSAAAPSPTYRFRKFARRHKTALVSGAAFVALLIAATVASTWQAVRATRAETATEKRIIEVAAERDGKEKARQESEAVTSFVTEVFRSPNPRRGGRTVTVAETLDRAARKLDATFASQPAQRARLQLTLGVTYHALGLEGEAIPLLEKARDYLVATFGKENPVAVNAMYDVAHSLHTAGRREEALKMRQEILAIRRKMLGLEHPDTINAMSVMAASYHAAGRRDEALKLREEEVALSRKVLGEEHSATMGAMGNLAISYYHAGRRDAALKLREQVLLFRRKANGPEDLETFDAMYNLANSFQAADRIQEALDLREQVLAGRLKLLDSEHPQTLEAMTALASSYQAAGRLQEAVKLCTQVLDLNRKVLGQKHPHTLDAMSNLADVYYNVHRREEALKLREETLALTREILEPLHPDVIDSMAKVADSYHAAGREVEALRLRQDVLADSRKVFGEVHSRTLDALNDLATSYQAAGRRSESLKLREEVLDLRRKLSGPEHRSTVVVMSMLADSYRVAGRKDEAFRLWEDVLAINRKRNGSNHPATIRALSDLASASMVEERYAQSESYYRELLQIRMAQNAATNDLVASAMSSLGYLLGKWAWSERDSPDKTHAVRRAYEAEQVLRDCLSTRVITLSPGNPFLAETRSRLGLAHMIIAVVDASLTAEEKQSQFAEAELLMIKGYEATREADKDDLRYSRECLKRLVQLHQAWGKQEKLAEWKQQLAKLDATEAAAKLSAGAATKK